jgi:hypothetical protein
MKSRESTILDVQNRKPSSYMMKNGRTRTSKSISRQDAKAQRAQRKRNGCSLRFFAPWRLGVRLFVFSELLTPWAATH